MHVVIAGAGIVGVSAAIWLQRAGHEVTLVDRAGPAAGASYGNAGVLAASAILPLVTPQTLRSLPGMLFQRGGPLYLRWPYLPRLLPFLIPHLRSANAAQMEQCTRALAYLLGDTVEQHNALAAGTKAAEFLHPSDFCYGYKSHADFEMIEGNWQKRRDHGFDIEVLTGAEVAAKEPMLAQAFETLVVCPNHGRISDPGAYVAALATHFEAEGGQIKIAEIEGVDTDGPCPALLAGGQRIAGDRLVLALGAWSGSLARSLGLRGLKLETERGYHVELIAPSDMPRAPILVTEGEFVITPMQGRLRVGGLVEFGGLKAAPRAAPEAYLRRRISQLMPDLTYEDTKTWMGHRPVTADGLPVIGPLDDRGHCLAAFGHQHVGLTAGPKTGRLIADMVDGRKANSDLSPFSPERYLK